MTSTRKNEEAKAAAEALRNEVAAETTNPDGSVTVTLTTRNGSADIHVPPQRSWGSQARHAIWYADDDWTWAVRTLSAADAQAWLNLDPNIDEVSDFFSRWGEAIGQSLGESGASRRSSTPTPAR